MIKHLVGFAAVSTVACSGLSLHPGGGGSSGGNGFSGGNDGSTEYQNNQATFDHFEVMGTKLGTPLKQLEGFKPCDASTPFRYPVQFYKLLDARCKTGTCAVDPHDMACGLTLDGTPKELEVVVVTLTDTDEHKVYEIKYNFPRQMLSKTSALGKSLLAKYGNTCALDTCYTAPDNSTVADEIGGGDMQWANTSHMPQSFSDNPRMDVRCFPSGGYAEGGITKQCHMTVASDTILDAERAKKTANR
jgi:hypothetical protein